MQIDECIAIGTISVLAQRALELCGDTDSPLVIDDGNNRGHGSVANERDICLLQQFLHLIAALMSQLWWGPPLGLYKNIGLIILCWL